LHVLQRKVPTHSSAQPTRSIFYVTVFAPRFMPAHGQAAQISPQAKASPRAASHRTSKKQCHKKLLLSNLT
jgi:hypothetical protein